MMMADDNGGDVDSSVDLRQLQRLDKLLAREKFLQRQHECDAWFRKEKKNLLKKYEHSPGTRWHNEEKKKRFQNEVDELLHEYALLMEPAAKEFHEFWNEIRRGERMVELVYSSRARFPHRYDYECSVCGAKIYPNRSICGSCGEPQ